MRTVRTKDKAKPKSRSGTTISAADRRAAGQELLQGIWVDKALYARLDRERERRGLSRSALVRTALEEWLDTAK
jgi:hypothetical protein